MPDYRSFTPSRIQSAATGNPIENPNTRVNSNLPYATDLIAFAYKYKFLFFVDITLNPDAVYEMPSDPRFSLLAQTSTRPSPKFEMDEVNLYGARTGVAKRTRFSEMKMTFLDDQQNKMMDFYTAASRWMSPITNVSSFHEKLQYDFQLNGGTHVDGQMSYNAKAHRYAVSANSTPFLSQVKLYHVYEYGQKVNVYTFYQPQITDLNLDDVDMKDDGLSILSFNFEYISYSVELALPFTQDIAGKVGQVKYKLMQQQ